MVKKIYQHTNRINIIASPSNRKVIALVIFDGNCDKKIIEAYVRDTLIQELKPRQTVIMDNINFYKTSDIKDLVKLVGTNILFLPINSPNLNSIANY